MAKEFQPRSRRERIAELEQSIAGYVQANKQCNSILADGGRQILATAAQFRANAAELIARAEKYEALANGAADRLEAGEQRIAEIRKQIATIRSEEEIAKLNELMEQYDTILAK